MPVSRSYEQFFDPKLRFKRETNAFYGAINSSLNHCSFQIVDVNPCVDATLKESIEEETTQS